MTSPRTAASTPRFRYLAVDPLEQTYTREVRVEKRKAGVLVAEETCTLREDIYLKSEVLLMLQVAGFRAITVQGDYTDQPATPDHKELVFAALP